MAKVVVRARPGPLTYSEDLAKFLFKEAEDLGWTPIMKQCKPFLLLIWVNNQLQAAILEEDTNTILLKNRSLLAYLEERLKDFKSDEPVIIEIQ